VISEVCASEVTPTYLSELFREAVYESCKNIPSITDLFCVFAHDPDQTSTGIRVIQIIDALTKGGYNAFVTRISSEDIFDHNNNFLDNICDFCVDQLQKDIDSLFIAALDLDGHLTDCLDSTLDKVNINLHGVLLELSKKLIDIRFTRYPCHNLEFLKLEVGWVVVFAKENTHLFREDIRLFLKKEINVPKRHILDFWS